MRLWGGMASCLWKGFVLMPVVPMLIMYWLVTNGQTAGKIAGIVIRQFVSGQRNE